MSAPLIVDASVALSWSLEDENSPFALGVLDHVRLHGACVPTLWTYETTNVLVSLTRRNRLDAGGAAQIGRALDALHITISAPDAENWRSELIPLALRHELTVYDATYLRLALVRQLQLATLDVRLRNAADSYGAAYTP